jgi:hypothetical protein
LKKTVPFELFGANQYLMFDMIRLGMLERSMGTSITRLMTTQDIGVDFVLRALPIAMQQHVFNKPIEFWAGKIENYLDGDGDIKDIAVPLIRAILATGVMGSEVRDATIRELDKLAGKKVADEIDGEDPKNEQRAETPEKKPSRRSKNG